MPPAVEAWRLNHWTSREVPEVLTFNIKKCMHFFFCGWCYLYLVYIDSFQTKKYGISSSFEGPDTHFHSLLGNSHLVLVNGIDNCPVSWDQGFSVVFHPFQGP